MPRGPRGEKRAVMSVWHDFIHRLEQDLAECRRDLVQESGQMQHRERRGDDLWVDTTQREIDWHKKRLACARVSYANFAWNTENSQMAANSPLARSNHG